MDENQQLKALSKNEKAFLSRRICAWCDTPLDRLGCSAIWDKCDEATRITRRRKCLKTYKPRQTPKQRSG